MGTDQSHDDAGAGHRPRRRVLRALVWAVVIAAVVFVLFTWVFPWVESMQQDPTMAAHLLRAPR